jgi:pimeloyl-ACP methyl ester carboxylesterase
MPRRAAPKIAGDREMAMPKAKNGAVELYYETFGDPADDAVLLINGLGSQLTRWPEPFCALLVEKGLFTIRFDNRDVGLSSWLEGQSYTTDDMAADGGAVLDAVGKPKAHIVGVSMGGMIAQVFAANYPERTLSLTSIMSSSGNPDLPPATPEAWAVLIEPAGDPADEEAFIARGVKSARVIGSPAYPWDEEFIRDRVISEAKRAFNPAGVGRQMSAVRAGGDRRPKLAKITAPTIVMHGADDPLAPLEAGRDTAANIEGAELVVIPGMGHDLPPGLYQTFADIIWRAVERSRSLVPAAA